MERACEPPGIGYAMGPPLGRTRAMGTRVVPNQSGSEMLGAARVGPGAGLALRVREAYLLPTA